MTVAKTKQAFDRAVELQRSGRLNEAELIYRQLLRRQPGNAEVLHMLGVLAWQTARHEIAENLIRQAVAHRPDFPEAHYNLANALRDQSKSDEAIAAYRDAIALRPDFFKAQCNLGVLLAETGKLDEAIIAHQRAIAIDPKVSDAYYNLGNALRDKGDLDESITAYRNALSLRSDFADAWYNLGNALSLKGEFSEAIEAFSQAVSHNPSLRGAYNNLSIACVERGRLDEAIDVCRRAVAVHPDATQLYCALANALLTKGLPQEAANVYRNAISRDENCVAAYYGLSQTLEMQGDITGAIVALKAAQQGASGSLSYDFELAALGVGKVPSCPPRHYLIGLFNDYADHFDLHLHQLNYAGPQLLFDSISAAMPRQPMDIIDLGCGTGLCGQLFRPMARALTGIDLAPRMIKKARQRGVYDHLKEQDITASLQETPRCFDLILAADVFIYVGLLDPIFEAAASALRPGGLFAFTIEHVEGNDYILRGSRRYAHSVTYIRRLASQWRFAEVSIKDAVLRTENHLPVEAKVIVLRSAADLPGKTKKQA